MLELAHPSMMVARDQAPRHQLDLNQIVDAVLRTILQTSSSLGGVYARRKIIFTSFCPDICAALNWKQPNYPVFFASRCGRANDSSTPSALIMKDKNDHRLNSLSSAVELAQVNNLLGIYVDSALLLEVPSLIQGIRNAGLLIGVFGVAEKSAALVEEHNIDAFFRNGIVIYQERSARDVI